MGCLKSERKSEQSERWSLGRSLFLGKSCRLLAGSILAVSNPLYSAFVVEFAQQELDVLSFHAGCVCDVFGTHGLASLPDGFEHGSPLRGAPYLGGVPRDRPGAGIGIEGERLFEPGKVATLAMQHDGAVALALEHQQ